MITKEKDLNIYRLENEVFNIWINAEDGMNLYRLCYKNTEVVSYQKERQEAGKTYGIPILFPTPNRTKNSIFTFEGKEYPAKMHGMARNAPFLVTETGEEETIPYITGCLKITEKNPLFTEYPFLCTLNIRISLTGQELHYSYEVINDGFSNMPFGFGLHPFFNRLSGSETISIPGRMVMERDKQMLPTGRLVPAANTPYDLTEGKQVNKLDLDDVYTGLLGEKKAIIEYPDFKVDIKADSSFSHMVVYTPQTEKFFCVEPQTCSTDAINLYGRGEKELSGLTVLSPGERKKGWVVFRFRSALNAQTGEENGHI